MNTATPVDSSTADITHGDQLMHATATPEPAVASTDAMVQALQEAGQRIAPVWPLDRFVAVNPYFGLADLSFGDAASLLARTGGAHSTMPISYYLDALEDGRITTEAMEATVAANATAPRDASGFIEHCRSLGASTDHESSRTPTVARVATALTGSDWAHVATDRISAWAAGYFDCGQAMWRPGQPGEGAFADWREEASIDRTPEIMGLAGFRRVVRSLPTDYLAVAARATKTLGLGTHELPVYLHGLLMQVGGWAAHCSRIGFEASLHGQDDTTLLEFGAILLGWELALYETLADRGIDQAWAETRATTDWFGDRADPRLAAGLLLQEALDRSEQDRIITSIGTGIDRPSTEDVRRQAQAVFCIDVRSEVFRRHLETTDDRIETLGFAGFFGVAIEYVPIAHERGSAQCPVLLTPTHTVTETVPDPKELQDAVARRRLSHHVQRAWKSFKMGAISCFSFVGPVGLVYLPKLFTDGSGRTPPTRPADIESLNSETIHGRGPSLAVAEGPGGSTGIGLEARVSLAEGMLRATSLNDRLAPLVFIVGHGASTANNPYESALHCGACGGNTGEANARVAAAILNDPDVRAALTERGLTVPTDTWFVAGLHDTTTDEITIFDAALIPDHLTVEMGELASSFASAGHAARVERAKRFNLVEGTDVDKAVLRRSTDWAQVRPEWGLAGCRAFIAAPRRRTLGVDLGGQAFLHSYDWRSDDGFGVLELILTAPVVVASWISLQYYASTVEPHLFGSGNKTLHNVVGRVGVLEGNAGDLRVGLPWQSIHDGDTLQHEPLRLNVIIEAPTDAIDTILANHQHVADLCDHGWIQLLTMDDDGSISHRYVGEHVWETV